MRETIVIFLLVAAAIQVNGLPAAHIDGNLEQKVEEKRHFVEVVKDSEEPLGAEAATESYKEQDKLGTTDPEYNGGPNIIEGDIEVTAEQAAIFKKGGWNSLVQSAAWRLNRNKWSRTIPYVIGNVAGNIQNDIMASIGLFHASTCLKFIERDQQSDYLKFIDGAGCSSPVGKQPGGGKQEIKLNFRCTEKRAAHEIAHSLGRWHEQSRPDRDDFVAIHLENVEEERRPNFDAHDDSDTQTVPYDYDSIMHYGAYDFSMNGQPTIVPKNGVSRDRIGQRERLSASDLMQVNIRYCPEKVVRLVRGFLSREGRVEVFWNGQWGTVCDDDFSCGDAKTICKYLGYPGAEKYHRNAYYGQGSGPIWIDDLACTGNEYSPFHCPKKPYGNHDCGHHEDAGVRCQRNVQLVGGSSSCQGRVEVYLDGKWGAVNSHSFRIKEARVICRQLGYTTEQPRADSTSRGNVPIFKEHFQCTGNEKEISHCYNSKSIETSDNEYNLVASANCCA